MKSLFIEKNKRHTLLRNYNFTKLIDEINNFKILRSSSESLLEHHDRNKRIGSFKGIHVNNYLNTLHRYEMSKLTNFDVTGFSNNSFSSFMKKINVNSTQAIYVFGGILLLNVFVIYL